MRFGVLLFMTQKDLRAASFLSHQKQRGAPQFLLLPPAAARCLLCTLTDQTNMSTSLCFAACFILVKVSKVYFMQGSKGQPSVVLDRKIFEHW